MAGRVKNFWSKSRTEQIKREIANYNKRIRRAAKNNPSIANQLPSTIKLKDVKEQITTASEYNKLRRQLSGARAETLKLNKSGNVIYNTRFRQQLDVVKGPRIVTLPVPDQTVPEIQAYRPSLLEQYAKEVENESYQGRFPTDRQFIKRQIGIEEGNIDNLKRIEEYTESQPGYQRASLWRDNYLRALENSIDANLIVGNTEGVNALHQLMAFIERLPLENFIVAQLREPGYLAISGGLLRYFRAGAAPAEDELEELNEEINRLIEEWDKYDL